MHGVPDKLEALDDFVGTRLAAFADLQNIVYLRFFENDAQPRFEIGVEKIWELRGASGELIARGKPNIDFGDLASALHSMVIHAETRPPRSIALRFETGQTLEIFDNSEEYESFSIPHGRVYV